MKTACSALFHLLPESWLGKRLDGDWQMMVVSPKVALACECKPKKGEDLREELQTSLAYEMSEINTLPDAGIALRADRVEALRAQEFGGLQNPSVDICVRAGTALMLVKCKYKAMPETSIVKSVKTFHETVCRKFDASQIFYSHEGVHAFLDERIVLFNGESKEKVVSMFNRLKLEDADSSLRRYLITDTYGFWMKYRNVVECNASDDGKGRP